MDSEKKKELEAVLDKAIALLPAEGGRVLLDEGPEETHLIGDELGFLRIGIAVARGALKPTVSAFGLDDTLDLGPLRIETESPKAIVVFRRGERLHRPTRARRIWSQLEDAGCLLIAALVSFLLIGLMVTGILYLMNVH